MLHWLFIHSWNHAKTRYGSRPLIRKIKSSPVRILLPIEKPFFSMEQKPRNLHSVSPLQVSFSSENWIVSEKFVHEETKALTASVHTFQVSQGRCSFPLSFRSIRNPMSLFTHKYDCLTFCTLEATKRFFCMQAIKKAVARQRFCRYDSLDFCFLI